MGTFGVGNGERERRKRYQSPLLLRGILPLHKGGHQMVTVNGIVRKASTSSAPPGHLKVNCPAGASEASLDCPLKGKAFKRPPLAGVQVTLPPHPSCLRHATFPPRGRLLTTLFSRTQKTGDSFTAVSGFVFYLAGLGSVSSCRPNRAAMAPICSRLKGRAKPAGFSR